MGIFDKIDQKMSFKVFYKLKTPFIITSNLLFNLKVDFFIAIKKNLKRIFLVYLEVYLIQ